MTKKYTQADNFGASKTLDPPYPIVRYKFDKSKLVASESAYTNDTGHIKSFGVSQESSFTVFQS